MHDENVFLGLGSNLGNRTEHLRAGLTGLCRRGLRLRAVSSFYLTEPELPNPADDHPWYVNCVATFAGDTDPGRLLELCLAVERERGRSRRQRGDLGHGEAEQRSPAPRTLDVDVLMAGERIVDEPGLRLPHPRMHRRRFVLAPFAEVAPRLRHPVEDAAIEDLLLALPTGERVWLLAPPPVEGIPACTGNEAG